LINITEREVPLILVSTGMMNNKSFIETLNRLCLKTQQNNNTKQEPSQPWPLKNLKLKVLESSGYSNKKLNNKISC